MSRLAGSGADLADLRPLPSWEGRLVTVAGHGGSGTSTVAAALTQGLAANPAHGGRVVLLDGALDADQAILHDTGDVIPGLQELVDAHRSGSLDRDQTTALTWHCAEHGYDLVLGLRRHRDWTVLQPRAVEAAVGSLRRGLLGGGGRRRRRRGGRAADRLGGRRGPQSSGPPSHEIGRRGPGHVHRIGDRPAPAGADARVARRARRRLPTGCFPSSAAHRGRHGVAPTSPGPLPTCSTRRLRWRCRRRCTSRTARRSTSCTVTPLPSPVQSSNRARRRRAPCWTDSHRTTRRRSARLDRRCR